MYTLLFRLYFFGGGLAREEIPVGAVTDNASHGVHCFYNLPPLKPSGQI